jgi:hypothetical protein
MVEPNVTNAAVLALKTSGLLTGGAITYFACKAARRTGRRPLRILALGFGIVTAGVLLAGITDQLLAFERDVAVAVESGFVTVGFLIILYSLEMEGARDPRSRS